MNAPGVGCGIVLRRGDRILMVRRLRAPEAGHWSLVGGKVDFLETAEDAARRECLEEVGLSVERLELLGVSEQLLAAEKQHWVSLIYLADDVPGEPVLREPDKHAEFGFFPIDDLPAPLATAVPDALSLLRRRQAGTQDAS